MSLLRKYIPNTFDRVIGQESVKLLLQGILRQRSVRAIPSPMVFEGLPGTGKTLLAKLFARTLACELEGIEPCNSCPKCLDFTSGMSSIEIDPAFLQTKDDLAIVIEAVQQRQPLTFVFNECHLIPDFIQASLFELFDRPTKDKAFIFVTSNFQALSKISQSRGFVLEFRAIPPEIIKRNLIDVLQKEGASYEESALDRITLISKGRVRESYVYLERALLAGGVTVDNVKKVVPSDIQFNILRVVYAIVTGDFTGLHSRLSQLFEISTVQSVSTEYLEVLKSLLLQKYTESSNLYGESTNLAKDIIRRLDSKLEKIVKESLLLRQAMSEGEQSFYLGCFYLTSLFANSGAPQISELQRLRARSVKNNPLGDLIQIPGVEAG